VGRAQPKHPKRKTTVQAHAKPKAQTNPPPKAGWRARRAPSFSVETWSASLTLHFLRSSRCSRTFRVPRCTVRSNRGTLERQRQRDPVVPPRTYTLFGKFADTSEFVVRDRYQHWWLRRGQKMSEMKFYIFWSNQYFVLPPPASMTARSRRGMESTKPRIVSRSSSDHAS